jgi:hypothetical protein
MRLRRLGAAMALGQRAISAELRRVLRALATA